jgi:Carboxypeptidase regulatory-like domain
MSERIGKESNPESQAGPQRLNPAHQVHFTIRIIVFLLLFNFATRAQSQQSNSGPDPVLPDAPQAQTEPKTSPQPSPDGPSAPASANGSIHGVVTNHDGAVYEGVHITLTPTSLAAPAKTATSDNNGRFQFTDVPSGPFQLTIASEGFATKIIPGLLHPGESFEAPAIVLAFATATSEVQVTASQVEVAEAQLKDEEQQRVFGVIPNFYVVYAPNAPPLNPRQKFHLAWRSSIDPVTFLATGFFAGIEQATNEFSGYGQGAQGYAKRFGANYADGFISTMIGSAILPSLLKQDPRYFYKGTGTTRSRVLYALANSVICKGDSGKWQVNYSGLLGNLAAGGISNLYYPASDRNGVSLTFENLGLGVAGSAVQNLFQEFLVRKLTPKLPSYSHSNP